MTFLDAAQSALLNVSASQIDTFRDCQRKWAWDKIEKVPRLPNAAAQRGTYVHAVLEKYLKTGVLTTDDCFGEIAAAGIQHLPPPGTVTVERYFELESRVGRYRGYMDAHWESNGESYVLDHKTTSDFKWMKTEDILRTDVQANIYAAAAMILDKTEVVHQRWVYYLTSGKPRSKKVDITLTLKEAEHRFELLEGTVEEMAKVVRSKKRALDLVPTASACMKYGGCPYISNCNLTTEELSRSIFMQMSLAEKLKNKINGIDVGAALDAAAAEAADVPEPESTPDAPPVKVSKINPPKLGPAAEAHVQASVRSIKAGAAAGASPAEGSGTVARGSAGPVALGTVGTQGAAGTQGAKSAAWERRDLFAANALQGLLARGQHTNLGSPQGLASLVSLSFEIADEMLKGA